MFPFHACLDCKGDRGRKGGRSRSVQVDLAASSEKHLLLGLPSCRPPSQPLDLSLNRHR